jgi:hypothetical protein
MAGLAVVGAVPLVVKRMTPDWSVFVGGSVNQPNGKQDRRKI